MDEVNGGTRARLGLTVQYAVTRVLADSATLAQATPRLLEAICRSLRWQLGEIWRVDREAQVLRLVDAWSTEGLDVPEFALASSDMTFRRGEGLAGRVWSSGAPAWIPDVTDDPNFPRAQLAKNYGFHTAVAFPILQGGAVAGVMEFLSEDIREPNEDLMNLMTAIGLQIGQFMGRKDVEQAVLDSEALKTAMLESALDCVITMDTQGRVLEFNTAAESTFGYERSEAIGKELADLIIPPSLRARHREGLRRLAEGGRSEILGKRLELTGMRADGSEFPVELTVTGVELPGRPPMFTGFVRDITDRRHAEEASRRLGDIVESTDDSIISTSLDGTILSWNPGAARMYGHTADEIVGRNASLLIPPDRPDELPAIMRRLARGERIEHFETVRSRKDGALLHVSLSISPIRDQHGKVIACSAIGRDISERKRIEEQIAFLAYHDRLTGLPNRAMFEEIAEMGLARARRHDLAIAVLYLDLDNFKMVNDSLGHAAGDDLLRQVAARLTEASRETDLVARLGGDEFLVLLTDLPQIPTGSHEGAENAQLAAETVAARIHEALRQPFVVANAELFVSTSIGISIFPLDAEDSRTLLKNADAAMYQSKKRGPAGSGLFGGAIPGTSTTLGLAARLRKAIDESQWVLLYQPVVDLVSGDVIEVEALLRWKDPKRGLVLPGEFIHLAEEMGYMEAIGEWLYTEIFRQSVEWAHHGIDLRVSFNLSPRQLWHPEFPRRLLERIAASGVNPSRLVIELTESAAMTDPDRTHQILTRLTASGLRFAIDDFGTGTFSISRLRRMPVDVVKIDAAFVRDTPSDDDASSLVRAIIHLARTLGKSPLAEGIETEPQRRFLVEEGCRMGQGHLFSPPIEPKQIPALVRKGFARRLPPPSDLLDH
ncbi:MAG TPA: EAL domain-containing protein [Actinomycetota bacterium]|nr:EAL domain-containing protein [Actinomycetota bacterium]